MRALAKALLRERTVIEPINDFLKNICRARDTAASPA
jgi:hypothetical protein